MPITSSKVSTKSTSLRTDRRLASSFFALHGPIKATLQFLCSFFSRRAVSTIGVSAIEMLGARSGYSFFAITDHAGQQEVAINGCSAGTFFKKSSASSMVQRSAPTATSATSAKPIFCIAPFSRSGVTLGPSCPTNEGATAANTRSPSLMAWISWNSWPLSEIAPNGQLTMHMPHETHLS